MALALKAEQRPQRLSAAIDAALAVKLADFRADTRVVTAKDRLTRDLEAIKLAWR